MPERYVDHLSRAVRALLDESPDGAAAELEPIAYPPREIERRTAVPTRVAAMVFRRDCFCCRYCGQRTILTPIMELVGGLFPDVFPFHPNWKGGLTHPAIILVSPVVDHLRPGAWSGSWADLDNLRTSCWPCNMRKSDLTLEQLGWQEVAVAESDWDGLTGIYAPLWNHAGRPKPAYHMRWMRALDLTADLTDGSGRDDH
jgi:hypothetical protein